MTKILLVEDDPFLIDIYTTKLKASGYDLHLAKSGAEAIKAFPEVKPDVMLLDIVLPEMEGWEVLKIIKKTNPKTKAKIIVLSNLGQKEEVEKGLQLGADKYLIKAQHTPSQVVAAIKDVLK